MTRHLTSEEFVELTSDLQGHHAVFYQMWEFGKISFTENVPTAGIVFDKEGEWTEFLFNPEFWDKLTKYQRKFIICHECLHAILNHGYRMRDSENRYAANIALDVVVNHLLVDQFNFGREKLKKFSDELCWIDTVFKDKTVEEQKSFEYYYNKLKKESTTEMSTIDTHKIMSGGNGDDGGNGTQKSCDPEDWEDLIEKLDGQLTLGEKKYLKDIIKKHFQDKKNSVDNSEHGQLAGTGTGSWTFIEKQIVKKKRKWETVIKKWSKKYDKPEFKDTEQWARINRRFVTIENNLMLPTEMELEYDTENKIDVFFFQDTSGSCWSFKERFFKAALSLPTDRFNIRLFCFDTSVKETSIKSNKIYGGGGTSFIIIEEYIQNLIKTENIKYPEAVFVITDGYGNRVNPEKPKKWYWFLSTNYSYCIPKKSNIFTLKDYE